MTRMRTLSVLLAMAAIVLFAPSAEAATYYDTERDVSRSVNCRTGTTTVTIERRNGTKVTGEAWDYGDWFTVFLNTRDAKAREYRRQCR